MASAQALRTLARPAIPVAPRIQPVMRSLAAAFSTTSLLSAGPPAVKSRKELPKKTKKTYKKKQNIVPVKKPGPGERKAFRKRIQLSNNSALPVSGIESLEAQTMARGESSGKMFAIPDQVVDQLRALEAFKTTQTWNLFRKPHVLVRKETVELMGKLEASVEKKEALKIVLTGSRLSGKSLTLLQAQSYALLNEWVVINIPEGQDLTNGNTEFSPIPDTEPMQFAQPVYCLKLLQNIYKANKAVLEKTPLKKDWSRLTNLKEGATLADLAQSAKESEFAWPTLSALWTELTQPGQPPRAADARRPRPHQQGQRVPRPVLQHCPRARARPRALVCRRPLRQDEAPQRRRRHRRHLAEQHPLPPVAGARALPARGWPGRPRGPQAKRLRAKVRRPGLRRAQEQHRPSPRGRFQGRGESADGVLGRERHAAQRA
ncbi:mitochondrial 37S ribosomal protein mS29 [Trichoderma atroviride]|uniref:mitochondrial 37S ribosomal protein mS29 n=1 Tax=Hypocrea atroviridis TaxID=63577 RepID=UPI0033316651|nr:hypothetical protein TrAtP1_004274 [Trichoderma atroviride]